MIIRVSFFLYFLLTAHLNSTRKPYFFHPLIIHTHTHAHTHTYQYIIYRSNPNPDLPDPQRPLKIQILFTLNLTNAINTPLSSSADKDTTAHATRASFPSPPHGTIYISFILTTRDTSIYTVHARKAAFKEA